ncbi:MAG: cytochrome c [Alphaproteobacteria bacterium]|jgi:mono/diheme cytochrome c family protein|nr:cytochrome c [Rhodospirillaceae bacterium]MDG2482479.1 cytochrome c [Alphaproteobacteria bacterium]MBT6204401.1 cytochrome c [Rhodospirillaceae bacterium]MBT6512759.1 cytochrome c [Rhodospirillaceae bacterium]MBT7612140.1 cytochrome c [Rhodospirillaceae bacterium]
MSFEKLARWAVLGLIAAGIIVFILRATEEPTAQTVDIVVPVLSQAAVTGQTLFETNCAQCHGTNGSGSNKGPPLIHSIYNAGHHADVSFLLAARNGVAQHHWRFGAMPPQPQVSDDDVAKVVRFIREIQQANGIEYEEHVM